MKNIRLLTLFILLVVSAFSVAQTDNHSIPTPIKNGIDIQSTKIVAPQLDNQSVDKHTPQLIGKTISQKMNISSFSREMIDNKLIFRHKFIQEQANGLIIYFKKFHLGKNGKIFLYSTNSENVIFIENKDKEEYAVGPISGKEIILQFETCQDCHDFDIEISEIGVIPQKDEKSTGFGSSGSCEINVNCDDYEIVQKVKRGVARIILKEGSGMYYCTGSLVNNVKNDKTPYFLTANHCGENASTSDFNQWVFYFNYESSSCTQPSTEPSSNRITGSTLIASSSGSFSSTSDFKLLQLNEEIPDNYNVIYNGWDAENEAPSEAFGIHHPSGDIKKISFVSSANSSNYNSTSNNTSGMYWRVTWGNTDLGHGVTEGGSSGSPLFNSNGLIVGTLTGGSSSCDAQSYPDFYGKVSSHWESNGTSSSNQLKSWLDPDGSGTTQLTALGDDIITMNADFEADNYEISIGQSVNFTEKASGNIDSYRWTFEGGTPESSNNKNPPIITYSKTGTYDVTLIVSDETLSDSITKIDCIQVNPLIYPNPTKDGKFYVDFGADLPENITIEIFSIDNQLVECNYHVIENQNRLEVTIPAISQKLHLIRIITEKSEKTLKLLPQVQE